MQSTPLDDVQEPLRLTTEPERPSLQTSSSCTNLGSMFSSGSTPSAQTPKHANAVRKASAHGGRFVANTGEGRFLQASTHADDNHIAEQSFMIRRLQESGRLKNRRLSNLALILPGFVFPSINENEVAREGGVANISSRSRFPSLDEGGIFSKIFGVPSSPAAASMRKRSSVDYQDDDLFNFPEASPKLERSDSSATGQSHSRRFSATTNTGSARGLDAAKEDIMELILALLDETARIGQTVIIIDDAHYMDNDSWALLKRAILAGKAEVTEAQADFRKPGGGDTADGSEDGLSASDVNTYAESIPGPRVRFIVTFCPLRHPETANEHWRQLLQMSRTVRSASNPSTESSAHASATSRPHAKTAPGLDATAPNPDTNESSPSWCILSRLRPFQLHESASFLSIHRGVGIDIQLLEWLNRSTDGNPGYLVNLFNGLLEQELIVVDAITGVANMHKGLGNMAAEDVLKLSLPAYVVADVYKRFDGLSNRLQLILKLASVIGKLVRVELLWFLYRKLSEALSAKKQNASSSSSTSSSKDDGEATSMLYEEETESDEQENLESFLKTRSDGGTMNDGSELEQNNNDDLETGITGGAPRTLSGTNLKKHTSSNSSRSQNGTKGGNKKRLPLNIARTLRKSSKNLMKRQRHRSAPAATMMAKFNSDSLESLQEFDLEEQKAEFNEALAQLKAVNFLAEQAPTKLTGTQSVVFKDNSERVMVYNMMVSTDRKLIHQYILEWHEKHGERATITMDTGMLGYHAMFSGQNLKAFTYFETGIRESLRALRESLVINDLESVECFVYCCKEITESTDFIEELENAKAENLAVMYLISLYKCKTYLMLAQFKILKGSYIDAKAYLRLVRQTSTIYQNTLMKNKSSYQRWMRYFAIYVRSPKLRKPSDFLSNMKTIGERGIVEEVGKCKLIAQRLLDKIKKLDRVTFKYTQQLENCAQIAT